MSADNRSCPSLNDLSLLQNFLEAVNVEDNGAELIEVRISEVLDTAFSCSKRE
jgi:hypothetical protein